MSPAFSLESFVVSGLGKNMYFEPLESAHPNVFAYKLYRIRRGKSGAWTIFYVPEKFNFILRPSFKYPELFQLTRRDIQRLRRNNPIKKTYRAFRATIGVGFGNALFDL